MEISKYVIYVYLHETMVLCLTEQVKLLKQWVVDVFTNIVSKNETGKVAQLG